MSSITKKLAKKAAQPAGKDSRLAQQARRDEAALRKQRCSAAKLLAVAAPKMKADLAQEMRPQIVGEIIVLMALWLHDKRGYGKKRICDLLEGFAEFQADMAVEETTMDEAIDAIEQDVKGFKDEFEAISRRAREYREKRLQEIEKIKSR